MRLLLTGWRQIPQHLQATQMPDGDYVYFCVLAPGHGGPHRHGQRYTKIEDHFAPIVKPLRDSVIEKAEHDHQQLRQDLHLRGKEQGCDTNPGGCQRAWIWAACCKICAGHQEK